MRIIKNIFIAIAGIIALLLILALFVKKDFGVEKTIVINKPKAEVFKYVKFLKNQNNYSAWAQMDLNMKRNYIGEDGQPGFVSAWESESRNVGKGEIEIKNISEGDRIDFELRFIKPFKSANKVYMITESFEKKQTLVKWGIAGTMKYPANLMLLFMDMNNMLGKDLEVGLGNLKLLLEKK